MLMGHRMKYYIASAVLLFVYTVRDVTNLEDFSENEILEFELFRLVYLCTFFYYASLRHSGIILLII